MLLCSAQRSDLKTANIFIKNGLIQLGDFGISKALTGSHDFAQTCIGTPYVRHTRTHHSHARTRRASSERWAQLSAMCAGCVLTAPALRVNCPLKLVHVT